MNCTPKRLHRIFNRIVRTLSSVDPSKKIDYVQLIKKIEADVIANEDQSDFTWSKYLSILPQNFLTQLEFIISRRGLDNVKLLSSPNAKINPNINTVLPKFTDPEISSIFHNQVHLKQRFSNWILPKIATAIYIGSPDSSTYVFNDFDVNNNIKGVKAELFNSLVDFLKTNTDLIADDDMPLFNKNGEVNFDSYVSVMSIAGQYFSSNEKFPDKVKSPITDKEYPIIPFSTSVGNLNAVTEAYFNMIMLNNFDKVISQLIPGVGIDAEYFESFNSKPDTPKYTRNSKGLLTPYWKNDGHSNESSEEFEDDLTRLIVSSIPSYRKDGKTIDGMLELKQLYLLGSRISKFELQNLNYLRDTFGKDFVPISENASKSLDFYIGIINDLDNGTLINREKYFKLTEIKEILYSLKHFIDSNNINEKEKNPVLSVKNIITQVLNNNKGAMYSVYNSNGVLEIKEMSNFDFQVTAFHSWTLNQLSDNVKEIYESNNVDKELNEIVFVGVNDDTDVTKLSQSTKRKISTFMQRRFSSMLSDAAFDLVIKNMIEATKGTRMEFSSVGHLKTSIKNLTNLAYEAHDNIVKGTEKSSKVFGDESVVELMPKIVSDPFYIAYRTGWLENYVVKPQMNIELLSGEKIPTFKIANLTYKDLDLINSYLKNRSPNRTYKNIFAYSSNDQESPLLGTMTKLEAVSPKKSRNKTAANFNVTESFKSNFFFDFLKQISMNTSNMESSFGVMLGNYSDKSTILLKSISANFRIGNQKVISMDSTNYNSESSHEDNLKELIRKQGYEYYKDTTQQVILDWYNVLDFIQDSNESIKSIVKNLGLINNKIINGDIVSTDDIVKAFDLIDSTFQYIPNVYEINSILAQNGYNSNLMEELHYTKYGGNFSTNRYLLSNLVIHSSRNNFAEFINRVENKFIEDYKLLISSEDKLEIPSVLEDDLSSLLKKDKLNISADSLRSFKSSGDYKVWNSKGKLNPIIQKWLWLNHFYRNEYLFISAKGEYMHPHKNKSTYTNNINIGEVAFWDNYNLEASGRLSTMAKRNNLFTATIESPVTDSVLGIGTTLNHAVIEDFTDTLVNVAGDTHRQDVHDGSSFTAYIYNKLLENSYPGKGYEGAKKPFGTFITSDGVIVKKDAESVISNWNILASRNSKIPFKAIHKKMLNLPISHPHARVNIKNGKFSMSLVTDNYYYKSGKDLIHIKGIHINQNSNGSLTYTINLYNTTQNKDVSKINVEFNSLYDLWNAFGAEYSTDKDGNFNEGSNDLLVRLVTRVVDNEGKYFLKDKLIHIVSSLSAIKAGGLNVNPVSSWSDHTKLSYSTLNNKFLGIQLDANHDADESNIKEVTQVISALSQNRDTYQLADLAYSDIAKVIESAAEKYKIHIDNWAKNPRQTKQDLYKFIARKFVEDLQYTKGDTLAKTLTQAIQDVSQVPLSNQNFFTGFIRATITDLNNNFISRYYSGTGAVLIPSHGIIQVYDVPVRNTSGEVTGYTQMLHNDIVKRALNSDTPGNTNDEIVGNWIFENLQDVDISSDQIQLGDSYRVPMTEELRQEINEFTHASLEYVTDESAMKEIASSILHNFTIKTLSNPKDYYDFKEQFKGQQVKKVISVTRDLKPSTFTWTEIDNNGNQVTKNIFDTDFVRLRLAKQYGFLSDLDNKFLTDLSALFPPDTDLDWILTKLTQRNLQLLGEGRIMKSLEELNISNLNLDLAKLIVGNDNLATSYKNVSNHYETDIISKPISNYDFKAAELILGDIYQSQFNRGSEDSMADIKRQGYKYFKDKLVSHYDSERWSTEVPKFKLVHANGDTIFVNLKADNIIKGDNSIPILRKSDPLDVTNQIHYIQGLSSRELLTIPTELAKNIHVSLSDGVINIDVKAYDKDGVVDFKVLNKINDLIYDNRYKISSLVTPTKDSDISLSRKYYDKKGNSNWVKMDILDNIKVWEKIITRQDYSNLDQMLEERAKKVYASWEKSHEFVASRIPAQSMQSFMPMTNIAYFNTKGNEAYVSVWQIWFQGSDFDVDKAYMLGYGFRGNSELDISNIFQYNNKAELDIINSMMMPSGNEVEFDSNGIDITEEFNIFSSFNNTISTDEINWEIVYKNLGVESLKAIRSALAKISNTTKVYIDSNNKLVDNFIQILNDYNADKRYLKSSNITKNSLVSKINSIISSPHNQILAAAPIDKPLNNWRDSANNADTKTSFILSPHNMLGMFKQQRDAIVGKGVVGISANGLKAFFALSNYYNKYLNESNEVENDDIRRSLKTFKKSFTINGNNYSFGSISDIDLSDAQRAKLISILTLSEESFRNSDAALFLSGFLSAATDNAKELIMAKVNASMELSSMHIYLMILGLSPEEITSIMTSDVVADILERMEDDIFTKDFAPQVDWTIKKLRGIEKYSKEGSSKNDLDAFESIYSGAQELRKLSKFLSVNQKVKANIDEMHKFLTNYESTIFDREDKLFGNSLKSIKSDIATVNGVNKQALNSTLYYDKINSMAKTIIDSSNGRYNDSDIDFISKVLIEASDVKVSLINVDGDSESRNVSILGGEFDYRYYIHPSNIEYRRVTKEYYNLIKDTFNVFDVISEVPHFTQMLNSLELSHNLLLLSSMKYNASFNMLKDFARKYGDNLKVEANSKVRHVLSNPGLPIQIGDNNFSGAMLYVDSLLRRGWLHSSKFGKDINFNLDTIKELMERANVKSLKVYTDDLAFREKSDNKNNYYKEISLEPGKTDVENTFSINMLTSHGIANFKRLMDKVLLKILIAHGPEKTSELLKVRSLYSPFGIQGSAIAPSFKGTDKNIPATAEKIDQLTKIFNELDINTKKELQLPNTLKWRHLFYVYNLLVNNEKYGDKRITPLLEEYIKESDSAGFDYIKYSYKLDSGEIPVIFIDESLVEIKEGEVKTKQDIAKEAEEIFAKEFLYYAYNEQGSVSWSGGTQISGSNPDFTLVWGITEEVKSRRVKQDWQSVLDLISRNNFLIQLKC